MNPLIPFALAAAMTASSLAADATFYLGTYTKPGKSKGIYVGKLDTDTGKLGPVELAGEAKSPSFVALSPNQKFLYASIEDGGGSVGAFAVGADGRLTTLNTMPSGGAGACHVWVDATGKNVLAANYGGGGIAVFQTKPDGSLGERTSFVQFEGSGPDKARQEKPHGHSIYTDSTNKFVYSCDLGTDNVWIFKFDAEKGTLTPANPPSGKVPPGAGPRHFALHSNGKFAYANNEMGLSVTAFSRDPVTGALTAVQTLSTLPEGAERKGVSTAEILIHPSAKWLYVSNRAHDTIAVYAIGADGKLTWIENAPAQVKVPRGFGIDPTGKWLITAGQNDDRIAVLKIDPATGKLSATDQSAAVAAAVCVLFAPAK
ncbi:MAG: lactonase family protein [Chthoniobacteraceae bacterium]